MIYATPKTSTRAAQSAAIIPLNASHASAYEGLTYPHFRPLLHSLSAESDVVAVGSEVDNGPVGLAIARLDINPSQNQAGKVLSLFVTPNHRNRGIGKALLAQLEGDLQQRGCHHLELRYLSGPNSPPLERILAQRQWLASQSQSLVCYASTDRVRQAPPPHLVDSLARLVTRLPTGYSIFPWPTLKRAERADLEQRMRTDLLMQRFDPFLDEDKLEPLNSLGLRYENRIVGWMITHRTTADTIRYTQMYVDPASQPLSRSTLLLAKAIQLQVEQLPHTKGTFRVDIDNTSMVMFVHRRLKPYLDDLRTAYSATKFLP